MCKQPTPRALTDPHTRPHSRPAPILTAAASLGAPSSHTAAHAAATSDDSSILPKNATGRIWWVLWVLWVCARGLVWRGGCRGRVNGVNEQNQHHPPLPPHTHNKRAHIRGVAVESVW